MKTRLALFSRVLLAVVLVGCTAQPQLRYYDLKQDRAGLYKFTLPKSYIQLESVTSKERGTIIDAKSVPTDDYPEAAKNSFMLQAVHKDMVSTNITQFATLPNTRIPAAIGIEVIDNRKEMIDTIAKVPGLFGILGIEVPEPKPQEEFKATVVEPRDAENQDLPLNTGWKYSLRIGSVPEDALPISEFKNMAANTSLKVFPYSACRTASLTLIPPKRNGEKQAPVSFKLKIADPDYVSLIAMPSKGQVTMHPSCGVDVKSEKSSGGSVDWGLLGNLIQKLKDTRETIDKSRSTSKK